MQISSFRESRSDNRRFYIFTATKTLHLRTSLKEERVAWIEALASARNLFSLRRINDKLPIIPTDISLSTEKLKQRLLEEGTSEVLVKDCEKIMLSEFSEIQGQVRVLCEERSSLLDTLRQLEVNFLKLLFGYDCYLIYVKQVYWESIRLRILTLKLLEFLKASIN